MLNSRLTDLIFGDCNFCHTFVGAHSIVFVRLLSNEPFETIKNYFLHLVVISIVHINFNIVINCFKAAALLGSKKLPI